MSRLREKYDSEIKKAMQDKFGYNNPNQIPESIKADLAAITGQRAVTAKAKKSIASFKVREGQALGASVTLRGEKMYEFLDRLISISLPRVRDFRGVSSKAFDGKGNYTLGLKEQIIFPEINYDKIDKVRGMGISIVTTANNNEEGRELLTHFGMPFRK